jgi:hypothetical protein
MKVQYKVLEPFALEWFRPVVVGELITLNPDDVIAYDLIDHLEEVGSTEAKPEPIEHSPTESE